MATVNAEVSSSENDVAVAFMGHLMPCIAMSFLLERRQRRIDGKRSRKRKASGRIGRTWHQRKKGELKLEDFTWWKLIHKPDVGDRTSRNGKVKTPCMPGCLLTMVRLIVCMQFGHYLFAFLCVFWP